MSPEGAKQSLFFSIRIPQSEIRNSSLVIVSEADRRSAAISSFSTRGGAGNVFHRCSIFRREREQAVPAKDFSLSLSSFAGNDFHRRSIFPREREQAVPVCEREFKS